MGQRGLRVNMCSEFEKRVWDLVAYIPKGKVTTYKELARAVGLPTATRAVGNALNKNPHPIRVPCHRVVKSNGEVGGYAGGEKYKTELLKQEGVDICNGFVVKFFKILHTFNK